MTPEPPRKKSLNRIQRAARALGSMLDPRAWAHLVRSV